MARRLAALIVVALPALVCVAPAQAPKPAPSSAAPQPDDPSTRITLDVTRVNMLFTVTDKKGRFVTNLGKEDFDILEAKKPQEIVEFNSEANLPLRIGILIDTSNSIRDRFRFQQEAATDFINTVIRPGEDQGMVVSFDSTAELIADLTDNTERLAGAIHSLRPGGGTSLYDAVYFACKEKLMGDDSQSDKIRRAIVLLSDGEDNDSRYSREQALEMAQKADVVIYAISTNMTHAETGGDKVLKYFAEETGGQSFFPFQSRDLAQSFENIASELRHQYNVFYRPDPLRSDGLFHPVDIKVRGRKDLLVRARHGYYAPKF